MAQKLKNSPSKPETQVQSLVWEDPLQEETPTHSSIIAWRLSWTEEPGGYSPQGRKASDTTERLTRCPRRRQWPDLIMAATCGEAKNHPHLRQRPPPITTMPYGP